MLDTLNNWILTVMDALLGWLLALPRDAVFFILAFGTAFIMVLIRKYTTDQNLLGRCAADKKRLEELIGEAKARGDKEALLRLRATKNQVTQKSVGQEFKPMLYALIPLALLTTWAWQRIAFLPPRAGDTCVLRAEFADSSADRLAHLAPVDGVKSADGWIKTAASNGETVVAQWKFTGEPGPHMLTLRHEGRSYDHPVVLGDRKYPDPVCIHDDRVLKTELALREARLFGIVPGIEFIIPYFDLHLPLAPWLVSYLLLALIAVPLTKRVLRVN